MSSVDGVVDALQLNAGDDLAPSYGVRPVMHSDGSSMLGPTDCGASAVRIA